MGWIIFEALLALTVMMAAAWWTFRGRRDPGEDADAEDDGQER
jgi:hypothetical protein